MLKVVSINTDYERKQKLLSDLVKRVKNNIRQSDIKDALAYSKVKMIRIK